jgi:hypothetical protein
VWAHVLGSPLICWVKFGLWGCSPTSPSQHSGCLRWDYAGFLIPSTVWIWAIICFSIWYPAPGAWGDGSQGDNLWRFFSKEDLRLESICLVPTLYPVWMEAYFILFLVVLEFEFRALWVLDRCSITWTMSPALDISLWWLWNFPEGRPVSWVGLDSPVQLHSCKGQPSLWSPAIEMWWHVSGYFVALASDLCLTAF